ncbi:MAG: hypothetical protein QF719_10330 [Chloroflexota bacterium]|nr:hypothetical protein [Chloroflexota bacterium]MDP6758575.1 hypothetical protein [Chloroflexota bacterium]
MDGDERRRKSESIRAAMLKVERRWGLRASGRMFGGQYEAPAGLAMELPELDRATGFGGVPRGKLTEFTGPASSGKLTLALRALATAVQAGGVAAYIDLPGTFYPPAATAMGIDLERLVVVRPEDGAAAVKAGSILLLSEGFDAVLLDLGGARVRPDALARLTDLSARSRAATMAVTRDGSRATAGLRFFASLRLGVRRRDWLWREGPLGRVPAGMRLEVEVLKTRSATAEGGLVVDCPFDGQRFELEEEFRRDGGEKAVGDRGLVVYGVGSRQGRRGLHERALLELE